jgi:hypothetical protein
MDDDRIATTSREKKPNIRIYLPNGNERKTKMENISQKMLVRKTYYLHSSYILYV